MRRNDIKVVIKPWGRETWFAVEDEYAGKILEVDEGERFSYQYHRQKKESFYVLSGRMRYTIDGEEHDVGAGESFSVYPGERHRVQAITATVLIEVSTSELDDVVRLEDDYGRTLPDH